jgi:probable phosphoglycerate mutase
MATHQAGLLWLVRHGETAWSLSGQHTGRTDIALTPLGEDQARSLAPVLATLQFGQIWTSPLQRAARTAELAACQAVPEPLAMEWHYGDFEGLTSAQIRQDIPGWSVWTHGPKNGESAAQVAERAALLIQKHRNAGGDTLLVSHGHFSRILAATWLGLAPEAGQYFALDTATLSCLGYEHGRPAIQLWNARPGISGQGG